jgi:hypothetical protein
MVGRIWVAGERQAANNETSKIGFIVDFGAAGRQIFSARTEGKVRNERDGAPALRS